jgi:hypothetical protein
MSRPQNCERNATNLLAHYLYLWETTVVRQAIETAWISASSGGHSSSYWCQQRQVLLRRCPRTARRWDEAEQLRVRDSQFPAAQSITYFTRALGAARSGNAETARAEITHLDEIEAKLAAAEDDYWAGQTRIQKEAAMAWIMFSDGQREAGIAAMRQAADLDDASEKNVAMENKLVPIPALLGELYLAASMNKEALAEFDASDKVMPDRFRIVVGAARAARESGSVEAAKRYYRALTVLAEGGGDRPEISEASTYLAHN